MGVVHGLAKDKEIWFRLGLTSVSLRLNYLSMNLRTWLDAERGRVAALAGHLQLTRGRVCQMADEGVPKRHLIAIRDYTAGAVSLEDMVEQCPGPEEVPHG